MADVSKSTSFGFATRAIHHGYDAAGSHGALTPPLYLTSTFTFPTAEEGARRFAGEAEGYLYGRLGNPTTALLEARMAELEGGEAALATASGMGAITSAIWSLVGPGDEIVTDETLYGCTFAFFRHSLARFGVTVRHVDLTDPAVVEEAMRRRPRLVYFETPANPNMRLIDIRHVAKCAHAAGALVMVDNTYCTPMLQRPLALGADLVVHSATKYLGGHGDLLAGILVGTRELVDQARLVGLKDMTGAVISPFDAFLILRGLKTLELRMARHCASAMAVARLLEGRPEVAAIFYPGLENAPGHALASAQMVGGYGGMIAFELRGGRDAALRFLDSLRLIQRAVSLGDAESLAQHPASMTHSTYTAEELAKHGISEGLIRLSIGLETLADIEADIIQAIEASQMAAVAMRSPAPQPEFAE